MIEISILIQVEFGTTKYVSKQNNIQERKAPANMFICKTNIFCFQDFFASAGANVYAK